MRYGYKIKEYTYDPESNQAVTVTIPIQTLRDWFDGKVGRLGLFANARTGRLEIAPIVEEEKQ